MCTDFREEEAIALKCKIWKRTQVNDVLGILWFDLIKHFVFGMLTVFTFGGKHKDLQACEQVKASPLIWLPG